MQNEGQEAKRRPATLNEDADISMVDWANKERCWSERGQKDSAWV